MRTLPTLAVGTAVAAGLLTVGLAAPASAACDAYSGSCTPPSQVLGTTVSRGSVPPATSSTTSTSSPSSLPFTGAELTLLTIAGVGALAGGTALVVAGRRRSNGAAA
jgi:LPXTG-motif cell wall-anchored protein